MDARAGGNCARPTGTQEGELSVEQATRLRSRQRSPLMIRPVRVGSLPLRETYCLPAGRGFVEYRKR